MFDEYLCSALFCSQIPKRVCKFERSSIALRGNDLQLFQRYTAPRPHSHVRFRAPDRFVSIVSPPTRSHFTSDSYGVGGGLAPRVQKYESGYPHQILSSRNLSRDNPYM